MRPLLISLLLLAASPVLAQQAMVPVVMKVSAGTGFFVNHGGDLVTNAHVINQCQNISVRTLTGERAATLQAIDRTRDLAVLHVVGGAPVPAIASLRWNIRDLKIGDEVVLMGYPGQEGIAGHYQFKKSTVTALKGPTDEPQWLQLTSVAQHGNSGGPVLDGTGNVIGVITGNATTLRYALDASGNRVGSGEQIGNADVAITLPVLEDFLRQHNVGYFQASSGSTAYADILQERRANRFIVPIRCYQGPK